MNNASDKDYTEKVPDNKVMMVECGTYLTMGSTIRRKIKNHVVFDCTASFQGTSLLQGPDLLLRGCLTKSESQKLR